MLALRFVSGGRALQCFIRSANGSVTSGPQCSAERLADREGLARHLDVSSQVGSASSSDVAVALHAISGNRLCVKWLSSGTDLIH
jgi:hypothetical protein